MWKSVSEPPDYVDFVWIKRASEIEPELAFYTGNNWQTAESAGDYEGLSIEYYDDVTHWASVDPPEFVMPSASKNVGGGKG